jgi:hypothetical protein
MSNENREPLKQDDTRAPWERPVLRRLVTKYAEGSGHTKDEGNPNTGFPASHSGKGF